MTGFKLKSKKVKTQTPSVKKLVYNPVNLSAQDSEIQSTDVISRKQMKINTGNVRDFHANLELEQNNLVVTTKNQQSKTKKEKLTAEFPKTIKSPKLVKMKRNPEVDLLPLSQIKGPLPQIPVTLASLPPPNSLPPAPVMPLLPLVPPHQLPPPPLQPPLHQLPPLGPFSLARQQSLSKKLVQVC